MNKPFEEKILSGKNTRQRTLVHLKLKFDLIVNKLIIIIIIDHANIFISHQENGLNIELS